MTEDDIAPPPDDIMTITRAPTGHGWSIAFDGEQQAHFSTAADLSSWIKTVLTPLDIEAGVVVRPELRAPDNEPLPSILHDEPARMVERKPGRVWRIFRGGHG